MDESVEQICLQAKELRKNGRVEEALALFQSAFDSARDPAEQAPAANGIGQCLWKMGRKEEANKIIRETMERLPEDHPERLDLEFVRAWWHGEEGEPEKAIQILDSILPKARKQLDLPDGREFYRDVSMLRGVISSEFHRPHEAIPALEEAWTFELPHEYRADALYHLGVSYYELRQIHLAKEKFQSALEAGLPEYLAVRAHHYLGLIHFENRAYAWAKQEFEFSERHAEEGHLSRKNILQILSHTCQRLGLHDEAKRYEKLAQEK